MKRPGEKRRNAKRLQPRQRRLLKGILRGKSTRRAALDAGYSERSANHPTELLSASAMREALRRALPSAEAIGRRISEGMSAEKTVFASHEGRLCDSADVIDFHERRRYCELAARLLGLLEEGEPGPQEVRVILHKNVSIEEIRSGAAFGKAADERDAVRQCAAELQIDNEGRKQ